MDSSPTLLPLIQELDALTQRVNESAYISRDERVKIEKEIETLAQQLKEGEVSYTQGKQALAEINKRAILDEVVSLGAKIRQLNPTSPRLESLRELKNQLNEGTITAEDSRKRLQELMRSD